MTEAPAGCEEPINWTTALDNVGGDESLLIELMSTFLDESPKLLAAIHLCLEQRQAALLDCPDATWRYLGGAACRTESPIQLLERSAHTLKGNLRIFASPVIRNAEKLELLVKSVASGFKPIDEQIRDLPEDRKRLEKCRLIEASGMTKSPALVAAFDAVPPVLQELEQALEQVASAMRQRMAQP